MTKFEVSAPAVVGEVIDGEAVIMDLNTGSYYSIQGIGAVIWQCIETGCTVESIEEMLVNEFPDFSAVVRDDLRSFMGQLQASDLIRPANNSAEVVTPGSILLKDISSYRAPEMQCFTDMQDLLLLDPVHDVGETGWPEPPDK